MNIKDSCRDVLVCECTSVWGDNMDAHTRNSMAMSRDLGCDLVGGTCTEKMQTNIPASYLHCLKKKYVAICFPYGSHYINFYHYPKFVRANPEAQLFWLINEYASTHPFSFLKKQMGITTDKIVMITNVENDRRAKHFQDSVYLNLNLLLARNPNPLTPKKYDICYYGTFRPDREKYFTRYFHGDRVIVSCSPKNLTKFHEVGCDCKFIDKMMWHHGREMLNNFRFSLYIEDDYTHSNYNFLANRFYEALFCNTVLMFDRDCENTIRRAGITVHEDFLVSSYAELLEKTQILSKDLPTHLKRQQDVWLPIVLREREQLLHDLAGALHRRYPAKTYS